MRRATAVGRVMAGVCLAASLLLLLWAPPRAWSQTGEGGTPGEMSGVPGAMEGVPGAVEAAPRAMEGIPGAMPGSPGETAIPGQGGTPGAMPGTPGAMEGTPGATPGVRVREDGTVETLPSEPVPGAMPGTPGATPAAGGGAAWTLTHLLWGLERLAHSPYPLTGEQRRALRRPLQAVLDSTGLLEGVEERFRGMLDRRQRDYVDRLRKEGKLEADPAGLPVTPSGTDPLVRYVLEHLREKAR